MGSSPDGYHKARSANLLILREQLSARCNRGRYDDSIGRISVQGELRRERGDGRIDRQEAVPVPVSASSSHRCTGRSISILPFSTSIAISQQVIAEIPSWSDLSIACAPASERCSGDATSQNQAGVSSTITASGLPHRMSTHPRFRRDVRRRPCDAPIQQAVRSVRDGAGAVALRTMPPWPPAGSQEQRAWPADAPRWEGARERRPQIGPRSAGGGSVGRSR